MGKAYADIDDFGVVVTGGRDSDVGVGGLLLVAPRRDAVGGGRFCSTYKFRVAAPVLNLSLPSSILFISIGMAVQDLQSRNLPRYIIRLKL